MVKNVVVLNANYSFLSFVSWKKAIKLIVKNKVEIIKKSDEYIGSGVSKIQIPLVVRLVNMIKKVLKATYNFSKKGVFLRDDYECQYCGTKINSPTIDHVIPVSKGGTSSWENCVTCCKTCNSEKGNKDLKDFKKTLRKTPKKPTYNEVFENYLKKIGLSINELYEI